MHDQRAGAVSFALGNLGGVRYELKNEPLPVGDDKEQALDDFVRTVLAGQSALDAVRVVSKYVSSDTGSLVVELAVDDHVDKTTSDMIFLATPIDDRHHARVHAWRAGDKLTADEQKTIEEVPGTIVPKH